MYLPNTLLPRGEEAAGAEQSKSVPARRWPRVTHQAWPRLPVFCNTLCCLFSERTFPRSRGTGLAPPRAAQSHQQQQRPAPRDKLSLQSKGSRPCSRALKSGDPWVKAHSNKLLGKTKHYTKNSEREQHMKNNSFYPVKAQGPPQPLFIWAKPTDMSKDRQVKPNFSSSLIICKYIFN